MWVTLVVIVVLLLAAAVWGLVKVFESEIFGPLLGRPVVDRRWRQATEGEAPAPDPPSSPWREHPGE